MFKRILNRFLSLLLAAAVFSALFAPLGVSADEKSFRLTQGDIVIGAAGDGLFVTVGDKRTTIPSDTEIVIDGANTATDNTITVRDNVKTTIRLSGVRIEGTGFLTAPIELVGAENVTLKLSGANALTAPQYMAALQVNRYATLSIVGDGSLSARGGMSAAGIGGGWVSGVAGAPSGEISVGGSVTITAYGGDRGAGIGGGEGGMSGKISIDSSARVFALGGKQAAGIGSGQGGRSKDITISSSAVVEAAGGEGAAGIGAGRDGSATKITVTGSASVRASGGNGAAALGGAQNADATLVLISENALVRARGGEGAAAIGAGKNASLSVGVMISDFASVYAVGGAGAAGIGSADKNAGSINIRGSALVESFGGDGGAGIGSGRGGAVDTISVTDRVSLYAYGGLSAAGIGTGETGSYRNIKLQGFASVQAQGGKYGAGIGGGKNAICGTIRIFENASVTAQGGNFGAGIGTGAKNAPDYAPTAGTIYLYGNASVRAAGGKQAAGVGGGLYASGGRVTVSDTVALDAYADVIVSSDASSKETKADYSVVEAALNRVPKNLNEYTDETVAILNAAIAEIVYNLPSSQQAQVDAYAAAVDRAISILIKKTIKRSLTPASDTFVSGQPIVIDWEGAESPKDRIVILKKGRLPSDTAIDPELNVPYGQALLSAYCVDEKGTVAEKGTASLSVKESDFLYKLGYKGLPAGAYTAYLCPEGSDAPAALANFSVKGTAIITADYSQVEAAVNDAPKDPTPYTEDSWIALQSAINAIEYDLPTNEQAKVDGFAKAIRDAITALVLKDAATNNPTTPESPEVPTDADANFSWGGAVQTSFFIAPDGEKQTYEITDLTVKHEVGKPSYEIVLLANASGAPTEPGWGKIPLKNNNVETATKDSVVSAINYVFDAAKIAVGESENFDTKGLVAAFVGAGAGCEMQGSFAISETALINASLAPMKVNLEYGASIGSLSFAYAAGTNFTLPVSPSCPGYIFKGWSTDEKGTELITGSFTVNSDLTFYANWEVVPVSIDKDFQFSSATLGLEYSDHLKLKEASANYTVSLSAGELPKGLSIDPATGAIAGIPTDLGTYDFSLLIVDANGTRTEEDYSITVFQPITMEFSFHTSKNEHSGTTGEIFFYYSYRDRGNGTLKESEPINLTELLTAANPNALQPESVDTLKLTLGAFVGEPVQLFFRNTSEEDGYRIDKVIISTEGGDGLNAFSKTYLVNAWIGHIDDANFFESGIFTVILILVLILLLLVGLFFFLRIMQKKKKAQGTEKRASTEKPLTKKTVSKAQASPKRVPASRPAPRDDEKK